MFRPCIDLHEGKVKQIVGGTLGEGPPKTNFVSSHNAAWYAEMYRRDGLEGGHVVMLGRGNESEARGALGAYPGGLQIGGGISADNAGEWLDAGASHVIVTSWLFQGGEIDFGRLSRLVRLIGRQRLVVDLSCRFRNGEYWVVTNRFQTFTQTALNRATMNKFASSCAEFLVHAVDVEGLCRGIDKELVGLLAEWSPLPTTYAGGARSLHDLEEVERIGGGKVHLTIGSALDIFGGHGVVYKDAVEFNRRLQRA